MFKDESGMTLVELLTAIAILGIFFSGIAYMYPQMSHINENNGEKMGLQNEARVELDKIKENAENFFAETPVEEVQDNGLSSMKTIYSYKRDDTTYRVTITNKADVGTNISEGSRSLHRVVLQVSGKEKTVEVYGYVLLKG